MHHYFLYQHIRLDTNQIFYIGIGKKTEHRVKGHKTEFERAYAKTKRSDFWKNVVAKTSIRIEILFESDDCDFIKKKEIELIKKYGRKCCDPDGILVNLDEGGALNTAPKRRGISVNQLSLEGVLIKTWNELSDINKQLSFLTTNIVKCCRGKQVTAYGYKWEYLKNKAFKKVYPSTSRKNNNSNNRVGIIVTNKQTLEQLLFRTQQSCAKYFGLHRSTINHYLHKKFEHSLYTFEYRQKNSEIAENIKQIN